MSAPFHSSDEDRIVADLSRELERLDAGAGIPPSPDFTDRVMAAVRGEPLPQPARAFAAALLTGRIQASLAAIGDSWRVATRRFAPAAIRAQALALVLAVTVLAVAFTGGAAVGAMNLLTPPSTPSPVVPSLVPSPSQSPTSSVSPSPSNSPSTRGTPESTDSASPIDSAEPTETAEPTHAEDHGGGTTPLPATRTPEPTDDHGGSSGSGSDSGDSGSSGSGGGGGTETPSPTGDPSRSGSDSGTDG